MLQIYTKQIRNKWFCYATINGYDHSFEGKSILQARLKMIKFLERRSKVNYAILEKPLYYLWPIKIAKPQIGYAKNRIDNL